MSDLSQILAERCVLVVDDERFSRSIICRFLNDLGRIESVQAKDGAEGLTMLAAPEGAKIAAVVCDFNMPVINGLQFLKAIRTGLESRIPRDLPVVMLTGHSDLGLVGAALALDIDAFVVKPVSKSNLESRLTRALGDRQGIKASDIYTKIDVDSVSDRLLRGGGTKANPAVTHKGMRVPLSDLKTGSVLAEDLLAPSGDLLLAAGIAISERMVRRLQELPSLGVMLEHVWIEG
jgi:CheY-like chemotaxis protein